MQGNQLSPQRAVWNFDIFFRFNGAFLGLFNSVVLSNSSKSSSPVYYTEDEENESSPVPWNFEGISLSGDNNAWKSNPESYTDPRLDSNSEQHKRLLRTVKEDRKETKKEKEK